MRWSEGEVLSGSKVIDLRRVVSGPFATIRLGDLGADVAKTEHPVRATRAAATGRPSSAAKLPRAPMNADTCDAWRAAGSNSTYRS
ncbi:MAG: CoA transferase [Beijerinckiaceae bacterium]